VCLHVDGADSCDYGDVVNVSFLSTGLANPPLRLGHRDGLVRCIYLITFNIWYLMLDFSTTYALYG
jgi:hypothetical protein